MEQRSKLARKPLGSVARPGPTTNAAQEVEYRTMSSLLDTEAERSRLLAKAGYHGYQNSLQQQHQQQQEFRSDSSSTPSSRTRAISAKQKDQQGEPFEFLCYSQYFMLELNALIIAQIQLISFCLVVPFSLHYILDMSKIFRYI